MDLALARVLHVLAIVHWIGGVAFVTLALTPAIRRSHPPEQRLAAFAAYEHAFAWQARISVAVAGLSGLWLVWRLQAWDRFRHLSFWWMDAMVGLWLVFALMLFVLEPLVLHRRMQAEVRSARAAAAFERVARFHQLMLLLSLVTVAGAVGGAHGLF
jgi:uncharacterized membrane protein